MNPSTYETSVEFLSPGDVVVTTVDGESVQRTVEFVRPASVEGWTTVKFVGQAPADKRGTVAVLDPEPYAVYGHCAGGATELWDTTTSRVEAERLGRKILNDYPVVLREDGRVDRDGGGVVWVEIFGPEIEESLGIERTLVRPQDDPPCPPDHDPSAWEAGYGIPVRDEGEQVLSRDGGPLDSQAYAYALGIRHDAYLGKVEKSDVRVLHRGCANEAAWFTFTTSEGETYAVEVQRRETTRERYDRKTKFPQA
jgi:hypothetical protein